MDVAREAVIITDHTQVDEPILYVNPAFSTLTGYAAEEVLGRKCSFLQKDDRDQPALMLLNAAVKSGLPHETVLRNYRKDGTPFLNRLSIAPIEDGGKVTHYFGFLSDVTEQTRSEEALRASESRWRGLFEQMQEGFYVAEAIRDTDGHVVDFAAIEMNPVVERLTGRTISELSGRSFRQLMPIEAPRIIRHYSRVLETGEPLHVDVQVPVFNQRWYEAHVRQIGPDRLSVLFLDISSRKAAEAALGESEARFRSFAQAMPNHIWSKPVVGHVDWCNERACEFFGKPFAELADGQWLELIHPDDLDAAISAWREALATGSSYQTECRLRAADGRYRWFLTRGRPLRDAQGAITQWIGTNTDIEKQKREAARLDYLSSRDPMTGLLNRRAAIETLSQLLAPSRRKRTGIVVLYVDLDHFKELNDVHGHTLGDRIIVEAAQRFSGLLETRDRLARVGGDEFLFLVYSGSRQRLDALVQAILAAARKGFTVDGSEFHIGASVGIAHFADTAETADSLICKADMAMHEAKRAGRGVSRMFDPEMAAQQAQRLETAGELRQAIVAGELRLFYQPIFSIKTGRLSGAEALVRWQHPNRGLLGAQHFISIAEESHSIVEIGRWGLEQACSHMAEWDRRTLDVPRISVNIAARHLVDEGLPPFVAELLARYRLEAHRIVVEVTESMVMSDVGIAGRVLQALHQMGVSIALDDFGTGFSNITYLQNFWFDSLKIDQTFVQAIGTEREGNSAKLTQAVIAMSTALGLKTIAEGVETRTQLEFLRAQGCDSVQGFLFSPAVPAEVFAGKFLEQEPPFDIFTIG